MPVVQHRTRRLSTSSNTDDLQAEIETLQTQLDTTQSNLSTLRGTNNRLTDRIRKLEDQADDNAVHVQTQERDINSLRRQLRISSAEITRLRTEKDVLERDYEGVTKDVGHERDERRKLMEKISELEEQVASALHLHVVSSSRTTGPGETADGEQKQPASWLDLKAKLREAENELDAVMQERDWLEGQLEKFIHAKDALDGNFSVKNLRSRTSMSSIGGGSIRSFSAASHRSTSSHASINRQSLGQELGLEWNGEYDSDADSDSTERADNESDTDDEANPADFLSVPKIVANDDNLSISSSKQNLKDFAMRLDTSGRKHRSKTRTSSFASSHRAPSIAASLRSRMSSRSLRPGSRHQDDDLIPPAPVTATAVFHEIERQHDAKVAKLQHDIVTLSTDLQGEIEILQQEVNTAREERDVCVLEIQRLSTELNVATARHHDSLAALDAALIAAASAKEDAKTHEIKELALPNPNTPETKEIGIQTEDFGVSLPVESLESEVEVATPRVRSEMTDYLPVVVPEIQHHDIPIEKPQSPEFPPPHFTAALEAEIAVLREQEQEKLAETLKLKSDIDILKRDLREKDTLLRAEVVRLERDLDDLVRDNRNMKDDAEINHYKVENLADELDRTRELLQIQAGERREFMEEIEQLQQRNRDLELQLRIRRATPSPVPTSSLPDTAADYFPERRFDNMAPFIFPLNKDSSSGKSDFEDMLENSENEFALESDTDSDVAPPMRMPPTSHRRKKSSSEKRKHHHSKKEKREKPDATKDTTPSRRHSRIPSSSKIPTASKIPPPSKSARKSLTMPRSISAQLPQTFKSLKSPRAPSPVDSPSEFDAEPEMLPRISQLPSRTRSSTLPVKIPRPSLNFRVPEPVPAEPQPDKTYWKDLLHGGYGMPLHEYNKHRRDMRNAHKNLQIKVTARGIETKGRVGTGAGFGVGNYAEEPELKPVPKRKYPKRRTSFSDDEAYTHKERSGWLSGMFRKQ